MWRGGAAARRVSSVRCGGAARRVNITRSGSRSSTRATSHKEIKEQAHRPSSEIASTKAAQRTLGFFKSRVSLSKIKRLFLVQNKCPSSNRDRDPLHPKAPSYLIVGHVARVNSPHFRVHFAIAPTLATYFGPGGVLVHAPTFGVLTAR